MGAKINSSYGQIGSQNMPFLSTICQFLTGVSEKSTHFSANSIKYLFTSVTSLYLRNK